MRTALAEIEVDPVVKPTTAIDVAEVLQLRAVSRTDIVRSGTDMRSVHNDAKKLQAAIEHGYL